MIKLMRFVGFFLLSVLLLFCISFAVLQTKTAKTKIAQILVARLEEMQIHTSIENVGGRLPFTWTIAQADWQDLKLSGLKVRIASFAADQWQISHRLFTYRLC